MTISTTNKPVETSPTPSVYMSGEWEEETESLVMEPGELEKSTTSSKQTKTEAKPSSSSSSAKKLSDEVSLTEIMQIISKTLGDFSELQGSLAKATEGFSEKQGKALIKAAQKSLTEVIDALAAQEAASKKAGIFQKITMAFTIAVTVAIIFASGGTLASALIPTAMLILTTAKNSDGEGAFSLAVEALANALPEGDYNKQLVASIIITAASSLVAGGSASALSSASATATTIEVTSQAALESGLPQTLGDATGKEWVMWLTMSLLTITMVGSGMKSAKQNYEAAKEAGKVTVAGQFAKVLSSATGENVAEMEVLVGQMSRAIQMFSQAVAGGFQIGTGVALKKAADAGYTANTQSALLTKQQRLLAQSNANTLELQERMVQVISDVYEMMTSLTKSAGKDLETLARQAI
jgi:hypothetical protein